MNPLLTFSAVFLQAMFEGQNSTDYLIRNSYFVYWLIMNCTVEMMIAYLDFTNGSM